MAVDDNAIYTDEDKAAYYLSDDQMTEAKARLEEIALATRPTMLPLRLTVTGMSRIILRTMRMGF